MRTPRSCLLRVCWVVCFAAACAGETSDSDETERNADTEVAQSSARLVTPFGLERRLGNGVPTAVAVSGDTVAVAFATPSLSVFTRGFGGFQQQSFSLPSTAQALALDADTLAVGLPQQDGTGAVAVFRRSAGRWASTQTLVDVEPRVPPDPPQFGAALALRGDTLAVGQPGRDDHTGRVLLFQRSAGSFPDAPKTILEGVLEPAACFTKTADEYFGQQVSFMRGEPGSEPTLVVGKPGAGQTCARHPDPLPGHVYVFQQTAGAWSASPSATLDPPFPQPAGYFGAALAAADGMIVVAQHSRVDAFERRAAGFSPTSHLDIPEDSFTATPKLDFDGSTLVVAVGSSVFLYDRTLTGGFRQTSTLTHATDTRAGARLTVAIARNSLLDLPPTLFTPAFATLVVGAPSPGTSAAPGAYVYRALEAGRSF